MEKLYLEIYSEIHAHFHFFKLYKKASFIFIYILLNDPRLEVNYTFFFLLRTKLKRERDLWKSSMYKNNYCTRALPIFTNKVFPLFLFFKNDGKCSKLLDHTSLLSYTIQVQCRDSISVKFLPFSHRTHKHLFLL